MFKTTKDNIYKSLGQSIKDRKETLNLKRREILNDERRVSKIVRGVPTDHYSLLICKGEYPRLNYLFLCEDRESFIAENNLDEKPEKLIEKSGNNYDKMLWGHIDWNKMFQDAIAELNALEKLDMKELKKLEELKESKELKDPKELKKLKELKKSKELDKLFKDTLVDYIPYAVIRYDELPKEYGKVFIIPDKRKEIKQKAIERVHLSQGSELFKQTFLERFSGKTLREFHNEFPLFISDYLKKRMPDKKSLGLQAYTAHINLAEFATEWQSLDDVQYGNEYGKKSDLQALLEEYIRYSRKHLMELEKFQPKFDAIYKNIQ